MAVQSLNAASQARFSESEWNARIDLAMAHRYAAQVGWCDYIFNHMALRLPDEPGRILLKRYSYLWSDVTASSLVNLGFDDTEVQGAEPSALVICGGILKARPDLNCVLHIHTVSASALAATKAWQLLPISQVALRFHDRLSYHPFEGIADDEDECSRLVNNLGKNKAMILGNHGLLTCGGSVAETLSIMRTLVLACDYQVAALATGKELALVSQPVCEKTARQWDNHKNFGMEHDAFARIAGDRQHYAV